MLGQCPLLLFDDESLAMYNVYVDALLKCQTAGWLIAYRRPWRDPAALNTNTRLHVSSIVFTFANLYLSRRIDINDFDIITIRQSDYYYYCRKRLRIVSSTVYYTQIQTHSPIQYII